MPEKNYLAAAPGYSQIRMLAFTRSVDDTAHDGNDKGLFDCIEFLLPAVHKTVHVKSQPAAAGTAHDGNAPRTEAALPEYFPSGQHLVFRAGRKAHPNRSADSFPEQRTERKRRFDDPGNKGTGFGDADMERDVTLAGKGFIRLDRLLHVTAFHADDDIPECEPVKYVCLPHGSLRQSRCPRQTARLHGIRQVPGQTARVDPDADCGALFPTGIDDSLDTVPAPDITGVYPYDGDSPFKAGKRKAIVKVYVSNERNIRLLRNCTQSVCAFHIRNGKADNIASEGFERLYLPQYRCKLFPVGGNIGNAVFPHRLDRNGILPADQNFPYSVLTADFDGPAFLIHSHFTQKSRRNTMYRRHEH